MSSRFYILITILSIIVGCSGNTNSNNQISQKEDVTIDDSLFDSDTIPEQINVNHTDNHCNRIDLDKMLSDGVSNPFIASLDSGLLGFCCYSLLDISGSIRFTEFKLESKEFTLMDQIIPVRVYRNGNSYIKTLYNEFQGARIWLIGSGIIESKDLIKSKTVSIGMPKDIFLRLIFRQSTTFDSIQSVKIFEDQMGAAYTIYHFKEDTLEYIQFGSHSRWIDNVN